MESPLAFAFVFLLILLLVVLYLVRETVPAKRTLGISKEDSGITSWESSFMAITPSFVLTPQATLRAPVKDVSGNSI
jgi:hypothetical protein